MDSRLFAATVLCLCLVANGVSADRMHEIPVRTKQKQQCTGIECDQLYWKIIAEDELQRALLNKLNENVAKNVILFLGDGMSIATVTASRIYDGQNKGRKGEENFLVFDKFPHIALSKTYNVDKQVADSASTGTAYLSGVKTNTGVIGFDARVLRGKCSGITNGSVVDSIAKRSQEHGKRTGFVTSTRVTHATPANLYAHVPDRDWECDSFVPPHCTDVKDIARQMVEDEPGRSLNVIMGGGFQELDGSASNHPHDDVDVNQCVRSDGRKLWQEWLNEKQGEGKNASFVSTKTALDQLDLNTTEYLMGIFANDHLPYEYEKRKYNLDVPTLAEMTEAAISILSQGKEGFFLLVEGGKIDHAHHENSARKALDETVAMNEAVAKALELTNEQETLIIVTADHAHTMTLNGYPERGNPITGIGGKAVDNIDYTTLTYADGPGYNYYVDDEKVLRSDPSEENTSDFNYRQQAAIPLYSETHGGEDVGIYANGPMAHLFHSVHEQNYIASVMAYASCVDKKKKHCRK